MNFNVNSPVLFVIAGVIILIVLLQLIRCKTVSSYKAEEEDEAEFQKLPDRALLFCWKGQKEPSRISQTDCPAWDKVSAAVEGTWRGCITAPVRDIVPDRRLSIHFEISLPC